MRVPVLVPSSTYPAAPAISSQIPGELTGPMIIRYEAHLHHEWLQSQHELESMQIRRRGGTSSLTRVDITGPPGVG